MGRTRGTGGSRSLGGRRRRRRGRAAGAPLLAAALLGAVASVAGCTDPAPARDAVVVDAADARGRLRPIWDELNLWKLEGWFGVHRSDPAEDWGDGWLRKHAPWVRYARLVAALGGNYAPEIAHDCDFARASPDHPDVLWECGRDGRAGPAAQNELARREGDRWRIDYAPFRTAIERVLRSGVLPHLNLSSSPSLFTGGRVNYRHYHWNASPVTDPSGWVGFVGGAFAAVRDLHPERWRVSVVNEPNCLILDRDRVPRHVGFAGGPESYARLWTATTAALREAAPGLRVHPGNYVTSATFPGEDNLARYLGALAAELRTRRDLAWDGFPWVSLSLYEVPDTELFDFRATRLARLYAAQRASGLAPLPVKLDELGIHHNVRRPFEERTGAALRTTLYAASWHAEAVRSFLDAGDVVSVSPWLEHLFVLPAWRALPTAQVYWLLGMLVGQLDLTEVDGEPAVAATGNEDGLPRLAVAERLAPAKASPIGPSDADGPTRAGAPSPTPSVRSSLRALATRDGETIRTFVVHHRNEPVRDDDPVRGRAARGIDVRLEGVGDGAWHTRHLSIGGPGGSRWDGARAMPFAWREDGCAESDDGAVVVARDVEMPAGSVWLFESTPGRECGS